MYSMHGHEGGCFTSKECIAEAHGFEPELDGTRDLFLGEVAFRAH